MPSFAFHLQRTTRSVLFFYLLGIHLTSYGQADIAANDNNSSYLPGGNEQINTQLSLRIQQVDSLSHTAGIASDFAKIYTASMKNIGAQLTGMDSGAQNFIKKFEVTFISYFLDATIEFEKNGHLSHESIWSYYFSHPQAQPWQLTLIGINAHINGDIWKGLVKNFSEQEIRRYKKNLLSFQSSISKAFQPMFEDLMMQSSYIRFINGFTKGGAKLYGKWLIYNWRLRQINLAMMYFEDHDMFKKRLKAIDRKRHKIDRAILHKGKSPIIML